VYILEAHPSDVWQMKSNLEDKVVFASPKNEEERAFVAGACVRKLGIKFPAVLDGFDNTVEKAYTGWPDRLYLIDRNGKIAYKSRPGPFGFKPDELKAALEKMRSGGPGGCQEFTSASCQDIAENSRRASASISGEESIPITLEFGKVSARMRVRWPVPQPRS